jgi:MoaA/NifB/PqqE/SkfB family radical SAM enzyme
MKKYFAFQWHITDNCDQRCKHCYIFQKKQYHNLEMTFEQIKKFLQMPDMLQKANSIPNFYITGGDPILHKDFWRMLELL